MNHQLKLYPDLINDIFQFLAPMSNSSQPSVTPAPWRFDTFGMQVNLYLYAPIASNTHN